MTDYKQLKYDNTKVQVESAIRDEEGYSLKGCYAKKNEIKDGTLTINTNGGSALGTFSANQSTDQTITLPNGSVQLLNQSATFVSDNTYEEFPYRATITVSGVTSSTYAEVTYSEDQATSLNFATFIETGTGVIYLYSRTNVGTVSIPTISIGMDYSDITIDATPTSGSGNAVSSGGVYTALATKQDTLTFDNTPTDGSSNPVTSGGVYSALRGTYKTITLPSPFTTGWCHRFEILPGVYLYQISDAKASSTGDFVLDASVVPSHQGTKGVLFNPDSKAITGLIFNTDSTGIKVRVLGSASDYMVGQALVVTY